MTALVRGSVSDRPWGLTLGALGVRGFTGTLRLITDTKWFSIGFENGAVIDARSSLISDSMARIAMATGLVTSAAVGEIVQRMAEQPERDEVEVVTELARLTAAQAENLRRRAIAQRAARTFSVHEGDFMLIQASASEPTMALDIRPIIYLGAMINMTDERLAAELAEIGKKFVLKAGAIAEIPAYGFTPVEERVVQTLAKGATIDDLEAHHIDLDRHNIFAIVYVLVSGLACRSAAPSPSTAASRTNTQRVKSNVDPNTSFTVSSGTRTAARTPAAEPSAPIALDLDSPAPSEAAAPVLDAPDDLPVAMPQATPPDLELGRPTRAEVRPPPAPIAPSPFDDIELAPREVMHARPIAEELPSSLRRTASRWANLAFEPDASTPEKLMRQTAAMWAEGPFDDEHVPSAATPQPQPSSRRPHSRTEQLLVFATIPRQPAATPDHPGDSPWRQYSRAASWLPLDSLDESGDYT